MSEVGQVEVGTLLLLLANTIARQQSVIKALVKVGPWDEDGYCAHCGNHKGKAGHALDCAWADVLEVSGAAESVLDAEVSKLRVFCPRCNAQVGQSCGEPEGAGNCYPHREREELAQVAAGTTPDQCGARHPTSVSEYAVCSRPSQHEGQHYAEHAPMEQLWVWGEVGDRRPTPGVACRTPGPLVRGDHARCALPPNHEGYHSTSGRGLVW